MRIKAAVKSDIGTIRNINQDNYYFFGRINERSSSVSGSHNIIARRNGLFSVFDGMGGEQEGEKASLFTALKLCELNTEQINDFESFTDHYVMEANKKLCDYMSVKDDIVMGTTVAMLYIDTDKGLAQGANIGDSKIFYIKDKKIKRITCDHNVSAELERAGIITEEESYRHKDKNKLTQYIGIYDDEFVIEPYISEIITISPGDYFIVCSDGLTDSVKKSELLSVIYAEGSVKDKANELISLAKKNGSRDNITVIIVSVF